MVDSLVKKNSHMLVNENSSSARVKRALLVNRYTWFTRGHVLTIGYRLCGYGYVFTGLCIRVKKKSMIANTTTFLLRNIFAKIAVELHATLYGLCRLNFKFLNYAKKKFSYRGAKLYYLRNKSNTESWVRG